MFCHILMPYEKKIENWGICGKRAILQGRINFLNRKGKTFDLDNNDLSELKADDMQPKLIHPDIISEISGVEIEAMYCSTESLDQFQLAKKKRLHHMQNGHLQCIRMQAWMLPIRPVE